MASPTLAQVCKGRVPDVVIGVDTHNDVHVAVALAPQWRQARPVHPQIKAFEPRTLHHAKGLCSAAGTDPVEHNLLFSKGQENTKT